MTRGRRALRTLIFASSKRLDSLFAHAKFIRADCVETIRVPNNFNNAIVNPTIKGESAAYGHYPELFHICLQRNNCSCRAGEFHDG